VADVHAVVPHTVEAMAPVGVRSHGPKLSPVTVTLVPPVAASLE
jgi:hypothetical protein